jgi:hypothetical protein
MYPVITLGITPAIRTKINVLNPGERRPVNFTVNLAVSRAGVNAEKADGAAET